MSGRPEPGRRMRVDGTWAYVHPLSAAPGDHVGVHVHTDGAYDLSVVKLGTSALLDSGADVAADRADVETLFERRVERVERHDVQPGSYVHVPELAGALERPLTLATWVRPWEYAPSALLVADWSGLLSAFDYPHACAWALLLDDGGRPVVYCGDGGVFRQEWWHRIDAPRAPIGRWTHVAASLGAETLRVFVDGQQVAERALDVPPWTAADGTVRIGATRQDGLVDHYLDGDVAQPLIGAFELDAGGAAALHAGCALDDPAERLGRPLAAWWPLDEEHGDRVDDASGNGRDGRIVGGGTWQIGGPANGEDAGGPDYDPVADPDRGHGLRFASDDLIDCDWPAHEWTVPADARSGMYAARVLPLGADEATDAVVVPFVVTAPAQRPARVPRPQLAVLVPTNTWHAYGRSPIDRGVAPGLQSSWYSRSVGGRLFYELGFRMPLPNVDPYRQQSPRARITGHQHLVRPERLLEAWLEREGLAADFLTDADLDRDPQRIAGYRALLIPGHNEYWSLRMYEAVDAYLRAGGNVLAMSGNTCCYLVAFDHERGVVESRKTDHPTDPACWLSRPEWRERWHAADGRPGGLLELVGAPGHALLGADTQGWIDDGSPRSYTGYEVLEPEHPLFTTPERVELTDGLIAVRGLNGPAGAGFEVDASPATIGAAAQQPEGLRLLAVARQPLVGGPPGRAHDRGAEILVWDRPAGGTVVNTCSIAFTGALACDPPTQAFVRNVLARFDGSAR